MMSRLNALRLASIAVLTVAAGCGGLLVPKQPPVDLYTLTPGAGAERSAEVERRWTLMVEEPRAGGGLESNRIAARPAPNRLQHIANVRWTERAPAMIQTLVIEAFESSGRLWAVGRGGEPGRFEYSLLTEIRDFQAELVDTGAAPVIAVRVRAQLLERPGQEILGAVSLARQERSEGADIDAIVAAFDRALQGVIGDLVGWAVGLLESADSEG